MTTLKKCGQSRCEPSETLELNRQLEEYIRTAPPLKHMLMRSEQQIPGMRPGAMGVLHCLEQSTSPEEPEMLPSRLSKIMGLSHPTISPLLHMLERHGYVQRRQGTSDRRKMFVAITDKGRDALRTHSDKMSEGIACITEFLGEQDTRELLRILGRVKQYAEQIKRRGEACE